MRSRNTAARIDRVSLTYCGGTFRLEIMPALNFLSRIGVLQRENHGSLELLVE
ncbi:MAG: hypothetical protein WBK18_02175 [Thermacetogeniaceae bacterium]